MTLSLAEYVDSWVWLVFQKASIDETRRRKWACLGWSSYSTLKNDRQGIFLPIVEPSYLLGRSESASN